MKGEGTGGPLKLVARKPTGDLGTWQKAITRLEVLPMPVRTRPALLAGSTCRPRHLLTRVFLGTTRGTASKDRG